jgi:PadR family transcriptional regulator PadR
MELEVRTVLLLALAEGPAFGLELVDRVKERSRGRIRLNRGGTYPALRNLEKKGLVRGWMRRTGAAGRPRRYYELTSRGIAEVERVRDVLDRLLRPTLAPVFASDRQRMARRVERSGQLSAFAIDLRRAARKAGLS